MTRLHRTPWKLSRTSEFSGKIVAYIIWTAKVDFFAKDYSISPKPGILGRVLGVVGYLQPLTDIASMSNITGYLRPGLVFPPSWNFYAVDAKLPNRSTRPITLQEASSPPMGSLHRNAFTGKWRRRPIALQSEHQRIQWKALTCGDMRPNSTRSLPERRNQSNATT